MNDKPWHRPGTATYARGRLRAILRPPVTVVPARSDLLVDRDVPVPTRDGVILRANVYRPAGDGPFPVILSAHPYGKDVLPKRTRRGWSISPQFRVMNQPEPLTISSATGWEAPDPVWWTQHGYVVINADLRGAGTSQGVGTLFSEQEGEDTYDLIEWAGTQPWSSGRVGMLGVSYLAMTQYRAAALHPPHLSAICPWEGFTDAYRDFMMPGAVEERGFSGIWLALSKRVARLTGDIAREKKRHPLRDDWWKALVPDIERIEVPMLVCTSFSDPNLHSQGSFRAFELAGSTEKFAYTHRGGKWSTFYGDDARSAQLQFFDRYLKDDKSVDKLPPVRLEVRESRDAVAQVRPENEWPLARTKWQELFLARDGKLAADAPTAGSVEFSLRGGAASFTFDVKNDLELTGPMALRLWVSLDRPGDANLFVGVEKWTGSQYVPFEGSYGYGRDRVATGRRRLAVRDEALATDAPLKRGEIVEVEIYLTPSSTVFRAGDSIRLLVSGRALEPRNPITGHFPAWYAWSRRGRATLHWGPGRESALTVPVI